MTMPWSASASPKKFHNSSPSPRSQFNNQNFSPLNNITHEIQNARSGIEYLLNGKPKTPMTQTKGPYSPIKSPFYEARQDQPLSRHRQHPREQGGHHNGRRQYPTVPRTADPRLCQFPPPKTPKEKMYYSVSERRVVNVENTPPPRYESRTPTSSGRHQEPPRAPKSSSHAPQWPNEKTPTSPYHLRQPPSHRGPPAGGYHHPAPHTAHPLGSFQRPDDYPRSRGYNDNAPSSATPEPRDGKRFGLFDFGKVKFALASPIKSANKSAQTPSSPRIPTPNTNSRPRDTRRQGFYEYQTPHTAEFDHHSRAPREGPKSAGVIFDERYSPRSPYDIEHSKPLPTPAAVPDDEKFEPVKETTERGGFTLFGNWRVQFRGWSWNPFQKRKSRIPSLQPDAEPQTLEEIEKGYRETTILAWSTVGGAWLIQFTTFGYIWSWNVFQDYYMNNYPEVHSLGKLAWISSLQLALAFAFGIVSGKLMDAGYFHYLTMLGSLIFGMGVFTLSFVDPSKFFHLFLVQGLLMGSGLGLVFLPSAIIGMLHFKEKKALITGIVMSGSAFGALIYPIMLDKLLEPKGFQGAVRASSYMVLALLVIANCLVAKPPKQWSPKYPPIDLVAYLKERHYALACGGIFLTTLALWFPQNYIEDYAVKHGVNPHVSFYSVAIIGIAGVMGRIAMGVAAEKLGPWNLLIATTGAVFVSICTMAALKSVAGVVIVSLLYGFVSAAWLSLLITALACLTPRPGEIGHRVGLALTVGSMGAFLSGPAHAGLVSSHWIWPRSIGLFAVITAVAIGIFVYIRILVVAKRFFQYV